MTKKSEGGGPYREQGPGVPREVGKDDLFADFFGSDDFFSPRTDGILGSIRRAAASHHPMVKPPLRTGRRVPVTFSVSGKAGEVVPLVKQSNTLFRGEEFFAQDDSPQPGHGTRIVQAFVGVKAQFPESDLGIPTWMFYEWVAPEDRKDLEAIAGLVGTKYETSEARAAWVSLRVANAAKMTWTVIQPALTWTWQIRFEKTCRWEGVLWGMELTG